jgi:hypothetical protein
MSTLCEKGFTEESSLEVKFINPMKLNVNLYNGQKVEILATPHVFFSYVRYAAAQLAEMNWALTNLFCEEEMISCFRTLDFYDISENMELQQRLIPLSEIILNKTSVTPSSLDVVIHYVEKMEEGFLPRIKDLPFLETVKELLESNESNKEMYSKLISLVFTVAFRGFYNMISFVNIFGRKGEESGLNEYLEKKIEKEVVKDSCEETCEEREMKEKLITAYQMLKSNKNQKGELQVLVIDYCLSQLSHPEHGINTKTLLNCSTSLYCMTYQLSFFFPTFFHHYFIFIFHYFQAHHYQIFQIQVWKKKFLWLKKKLRND